MRNPVVWRASHVRHHTDTIIVGRDPEIVAMRPPDLVRIGLMFIGISDFIAAIRRMFLHASGRIHPEEAVYLRDADHHLVGVSRCLVDSRIRSALGAPGPAAARRRSCTALCHPRQCQ